MIDAVDDLDNDILNGPAELMTSPESSTTVGAPNTPGEPWTARLIPNEKVWYTQKPPPRNYLLRDEAGSGVMVAGKVGMLLAEGGIGKTMVAVQLANAVATGGAWLSSMAATTGCVLMILGEEDLGEVRRRSYYARLSVGGEMPPDGAITFLPLSGITAAFIESEDRGRTFNESKFLDWLRAEVASNKYQLIVLDPLSRFAGPEAEVNNAAATQFIQACESLSGCGKATILVVHHTNKASRAKGVEVTSASSRGSSAFTDGSRWVATMTATKIKHENPDNNRRLGKIVTFEITKSNYAPMGEPVKLRYDNENGGALLKLDASDLETVRKALEPPKAANKRNELAEDTEALLKILGSYPDGLTSNKLLTKLRADRGTCSSDRFKLAIEDLGDLIKVIDAPNRSKLYQTVAEARSATSAGDLPEIAEEANGSANLDLSEVLQ